MKNKITPWVTAEYAKDPKTVLVGGTNDLGRHGAGIVVDMVKYFGLVEGFSEGLIGQSYAFPTVHTLRPYTTYSIEELKPVVDRLYECAVNNPDRIFYISEVGCGLAGMKYQDVAHLFYKFLSLDNCTLPLPFIRVLIDYVVYGFNTKYAQGLTHNEIAEVLNKFPWVTPYDFNQAFFDSGTAIVIDDDDEIITYRTDVCDALNYAVENRELTESEFD